MTSHPSRLLCRGTSIVALWLVFGAASLAAIEPPALTRLEPRVEDFEPDVEWTSIQLSGEPIGCSRSVTETTTDRDGRAIVRTSESTWLPESGDDFTATEENVTISEIHEFDALPPYALLRASSTHRAMDSEITTTLDRVANGGVRIVQRTGESEHSIDLAEFDFTFADTVTTSVWLAANPAVGERIRVRTFDLEEARISYDELTIERIDELEGDRSFHLTIESENSRIYESLYSQKNGHVSTTYERLFIVRTTEEVARRIPRNLLDVLGPATGYTLDEPSVRPTALLRIVLEYQDEGVVIEPGPLQSVTVDEETGVTRIEVDVTKQSTVVATEAERADGLRESIEYPLSHPSIRDHLEDAIRGTTTPKEQVARLLAFTDDFIEDSYVDEPGSVLEILEGREGDCSAHATLFCTLARAAGIPTREISGVMMTDDPDLPFERHTWNEVVLDDVWVPVDPTWRQLPIDAGHVRFATTSEAALGLFATEIDFEVVEVVEAPELDVQPTFEMIDDPSVVAAKRAGGEPVDLVEALLIDSEIDTERFDLDYDDYARFIQHDPARSREVFTKRVADASLRTGARAEAAVALLSIGEPHAAEFLLSLEGTEDPHGKTIWFRALDELGGEYQHKAKLAAATMLALPTSSPLVSDELLSQCVSLTATQGGLRHVAARIGRISRADPISRHLVSALTYLLESDDAEVQTGARAIRTRFLESRRESLVSANIDYGIESVLCDFAEAGDEAILRAAIEGSTHPMSRARMMGALLRIHYDAELFERMLEESEYQIACEALLGAKEIPDHALETLRAARKNFGESDWAPWVVLASRGSRDDRALVKAEAKLHGITPEVALRVAAELNAITTEDALSGLVELGLLDAAQLAGQADAKDAVTFDASKIAWRLGDSRHCCLLPVIPEGNTYVLATLYRIVGITNGKLRPDSASIRTGLRVPGASTLRREIELVADDRCFRASMPQEDQDEFEPDVIPLIELCNRVLESKGISERIHYLAFEDPILLFAAPPVVDAARDRGFLPK